MAETRMLRIGIALLAVALSAAPVLAQPTDDLPAGGGATPPASAGTPFPGAGTVLGTQPMPLIPSPPPPAPQHSPDILGVTYDRSRSGGVVWIADQNRNASPAQPSLFAITPSVTHTILTSIMLYQSACISAPGVPAIPGGTTGIGIVPSRQGFNGPRTLLAGDFNGDLAVFDDNLAEVDLDVPATGPGTANLRNVWYMDSADCPASCRPNTSTNVPQARVNAMRGVISFDYIPGEAGDNRHFVLMISACSDARFTGCNTATPAITLATLTEGCPGTWTAIQAIGTMLPFAPFQWAPSYSGQDPHNQSYYMMDNGNGAVPPNFPARLYELKWDRTAMSFRVLQSFPSFDGFMAGFQPVPNTNPAYAKCAGRRTATVATVQTGDTYLTLIPSGNTVQLTSGTPQAGAAWRLLGSLTANFGFPIDRDRFIALDPDALFFLTVAGLLGNSGVLDPSGNGVYVIPVTLPPGIMINFQGILFGNPAEDDLGVMQISQPIVWVSP